MGAVVKQLGEGVRKSRSGREEEPPQKGKGKEKARLEEAEMHACIHEQEQGTDRRHRQHRRAADSLGRAT